MTAIPLKAELRTGTGKGAARRLRREGLLPAVLYAGGDSATSLSVEPRAFTKAVMGPLRRNAVLKLELDGGASHMAMVKDVQKHPVRRTPTHVDFWEIDTTKPVTVNVPFGTTGRSKAVVAGAKLQLVKRTLTVKCMPDAIPELITVDITETPQGALRGEAVPMPAGVELLDDPRLTVLTLSRPRGVLDEEAEGDAAAPAAEAPAAS